MYNGRWNNSKSNYNSSSSDRHNRYSDNNDGFQKSNQRHPYSRYNNNTGNNNRNQSRRTQEQDRVKSLIPQNGSIQSLAILEELRSSSTDKRNNIEPSNKHGHTESPPPSYIKNNTYERSPISTPNETIIKPTDTSTSAVLKPNSNPASPIAKNKSSTTPTARNNSDSLINRRITAASSQIVATTSENVPNDKAQMDTAEVSNTSSVSDPSADNFKNDYSKEEGKLSPNETQDQNNKINNPDNISVSIVQPEVQKLKNSREKRVTDSSFFISNKKSKLKPLFGKSNNLAFNQTNTSMNETQSENVETSLKNMEPPSNETLRSPFLKAESSKETSATDNENCSSQKLPDFQKLKAALSSLIAKRPLPHSNDISKTRGASIKFGEEVKSSSPSHSTPHIEVNEKENIPDPIDNAISETDKNPLILLTEDIVIKRKTSRVKEPFPTSTLLTATDGANRVEEVIKTDRIEDHNLKHNSTVDINKYMMERDSIPNHNKQNTSIVNKDDFVLHSEGNKGQEIKDQDINEKKIIHSDSVPEPATANTQNPDVRVVYPLSHVSSTSINANPIDNSSIETTKSRDEGRSDAMQIQNKIAPSPENLVQKPIADTIQKGSDSASEKVLLVKAEEMPQAKSGDDVNLEQTLNIHNSEGNTKVEHAVIPDSNSDVVKLDTTTFKGPTKYVSSSTTELEVTNANEEHKPETVTLAHDGDVVMEDAFEQSNNDSIEENSINNIASKRIPKDKISRRTTTSSLIKTDASAITETSYKRIISRLKGKVTKMKNEKTLMNSQVSRLSKEILNYELKVSSLIGKISDIENDRHGLEKAYNSLCAKLKEEGDKNIAGDHQILSSNTDGGSNASEVASSELLSLEKKVAERIEEYRKYTKLLTDRQKTSSFTPVEDLQVSMESPLVKELKNRLVKSRREVIQIQSLMKTRTISLNSYLTKVQNENKLLKAELAKSKEYFSSIGSYMSKFNETTMKYKKNSEEQAAKILELNRKIKSKPNNSSMNGDHEKVIQANSSLTIKCNKLFTAYQQIYDQFTVTKEKVTGLKASLLKEQNLNSELGKVINQQNSTIKMLSQNPSNGSGEDSSEGYWKGEYERVVQRRNEEFRQTQLQIANIHKNYLKLLADKEKGYQEVLQNLTSNPLSTNSPVDNFAQLSNINGNNDAGPETTFVINTNKTQQNSNSTLLRP